MRSKIRDRRSGCTVLRAALARALLCVCTRRGGGSAVSWGARAGTALDTIARLPYTSLLLLIISRLPLRVRWLACPCGDQLMAAVETLRRDALLFHLGVLALVAIIVGQGVGIYVGLASLST